MPKPFTPTAPAARALLQCYRGAATPFFLAGPQGTLLADGAGRPILPGPRPLAERVQHAWQDEDEPGGLVLGALPFDPRDAAALQRVSAVLRAGPLGAPAAARVTPLACTRRAVPPPRTYAAGVAELVRRIRACDVDKVVLARVLELAAERPVDLPAVLARLASVNPLGYTFAVALPGARTLVGASPELLVSRTGGQLRANPLAGSVPRATDPTEDRRRAEALLRSPKDLAEHRVVVQAVEQALRPLCPRLVVPARPSLLQTQRMWHLSSEITGPTEADALTLALALHPTPAVCGFPRPRAQALIEALEPFDRGFYSGAVGWVDRHGDGEWVVALRCAEVDGRLLRLFAGAGIVADSSPEAELAETAAKLRTMLDALGLSPEEVRARALEAAA